MQKHRESLTQTEKFLGFKRAFETYKKHMDKGNVIAAYVVGFSIFEDRVTAAFMLAKDSAEQQRPAGFVFLAKKIRFLGAQCWITAEEREMWLLAADERNSLFHAAMWNVEAVQEEDASGVIAFARSADKLCRKIRRQA